MAGLLAAPVGEGPRMRLGVLGVGIVQAVEVGDLGQHHQVGALRGQLGDGLGGRLQVGLLVLPRVELCQTELHGPTLSRGAPAHRRPAET